MKTFPLASRRAMLPVSVLCGLLTWSHLSTPRTPVSVIVGLDTSRSVRMPLPSGGTLLGRSRALLADMTGRLQPGLDHVTVAGVDRQALEFFDSDAPESSEEFLQNLLDQTKSAPQTDGTYPAEFWTLAAQRAASVSDAPGVAVAVLLLSDGDNDDFSPASQVKMRNAARLLAANKRVIAVAFVGAAPKNWATLRSLFAPLGSRLHLQAPQDMDSDSLLQKLETARRAAEAQRS